MLRKRTRSHQKDQNMIHLKSDTISESCFGSDVLRQKHRTSPFFIVPGLFVGFTPKPSESDSVKSPTSPLDLRVFSNLANPFRPSRSSFEGHQKSWDCSKLGLRIIDSLDEDDDDDGKILHSLDNKNVLFGPQMRIKTPNPRICIDSFEASQSLPKNYGVLPRTQVKPSNLQVGNSDFLLGIGETALEPRPFGKILSCSLDSGSSGSHLTNLTNHRTNLSYRNFGSENGTNPASSPLRLNGEKQNSVNLSAATKPSSIPISTGSTHDFIGPLSAKEIELSEDYTCVKTYGPNPKTTHIFGDCILECHSDDLNDSSKNEEEKVQLPPAVAVKCSETPTPYPSSAFLSFCYSCKKKLDGEDIYMYRGEKAFCSWSCRSQEILIEEAMERTVRVSPGTSPAPEVCEEPSGLGIFIAS